MANRLQYWRPSWCHVWITPDSNTKGQWRHTLIKMTLHFFLLMFISFTLNRHFTFALWSEGADVGRSVQVETQFTRNQGLAHCRLIQLQELGVATHLYITSVSLFMSLDIVANLKSIKFTWWQKGLRSGQGSAGRGGGIICFSSWCRCWWSSCNLNFLALRWTSILVYWSWWLLSYSRESLVDLPAQHSIRRLQQHISVK